MRMISIVAAGSLGATAFVLVTAACSSSTSTTPTTDAAVAPARCGIDPLFPPRGDSAGGSCSAARYALTCTVAGGGGATCVSDDPTRCDTGTVQTSDCKSDCAPNEYGVGCGGPIADAGETQVPKTCRTLAAGPGGHFSYCCPCD